MFPLVGYALLFVVIGVGFILIHLLIGKLVRPNRPHAEKETIYECGEPTIGSAWVQFDLRFYVVALLFVIFDVEVAFFFPWAVVFGKANAVAQQTAAPAEEQRAAYEANLLSLDPEYREREQARAAALARDGREIDPERVAEQNSKTARGLGWLAFWDILVFFGVLLVGFAYLWKRGDLAWVRSVSSESATPLPALARGEARPLAGAGSGS